MDEKQITQTVGQHLYQQIKEPWTEATLTVTCTQDKLICEASFISESTPDSSTPLEIKEEVKTSFIQFCHKAGENLPQSWQSAIFKLSRSGQFSLDFTTDLPGEINI